MANKNMAKPIVETDKPGGKAIKYWPSAKAASEYYSIHQVNISYNVNGRTKQAKGHYFRYATQQETNAYKEILISSSTQKSTDPPPIEEKSEYPNVQVETIPEAVERNENQEDIISPFDRLIQEGKKKLNENSL